MENKDKDNLEAAIIKKINTTMIGSISDVEEFFDFLWTGTPTENKAQFKKIFQELRQSILDRGNHQIRKLKTDLNNFDVKSKVYTYQFKVKD